MEKIKYTKTLSRNDTGETKSHQSGITIPKEVALSGVFPILGVEHLNPREEVTFYDDNNFEWKFQYIYYNDIHHGKPKKLAHDEHRLTCTRKYINLNGLKSGDSISFSLDESGKRKISFEKAKIENDDTSSADGPFVIKLKAGWKCIKM